jgi:Cys-rich protein (TIGR01571 family)
MYYVAEKLGEEGCGALCCCCNFLVALRTKQRTAYDIKGSVCGDLMTTCFCPCCAATQMYREYKNTKVAM